MCFYEYANVLRKCFCNVCVSAHEKVGKALKVTLCGHNHNAAKATDAPHP